jgi:putative transposase
MARPLRIEFPGALYHLIARGNRKGAIFEDTADRRLFLNILGEVVRDFDWICTSYCLMGNHYHLVVETREANLSLGMRQLNGVFTQASNRRHDRCGHLLQGRYKSILVDKESYFLELSRYVVLNPVRAELVEAPANWPWSSYRGTLDRRYAPDWLARDQLLAHFSESAGTAIRKYANFVAQGVDTPPESIEINRQIFMGDDTIVACTLARSGAEKADPNIPREHRRPPALPLHQYSIDYPTRNDAIVAAYRSGEFSYQQLAAHFGVHFTTIGRIVRASRSERN